MYLTILFIVSTKYKYYIIYIIICCFFYMYKKAQVSSLNLEKQRLSSELDMHRKMETASKMTSGKYSYK